MMFGKSCVSFDTGMLIWSELMSCVTSLTDGGCQVSSLLLKQYHFTNVPVEKFWRDDIFRTGVYYCTLDVQWYIFCQKD